MSQTYGILYLAGILLHFVLGWRIAKRYGLKHRVWIAAGICYMLGMTIGAKLLFDLQYDTVDLWALFQAERWLRGGLLSLTQLLCLSAAMAALLMLTLQLRQSGNSIHVDV
jgi:prolipoprotein diacylglyceryltransferase